MDHRAAEERPAALSEVALAHLHLWLVQRQVELISPAAATSTALNAAMQMLEAAVRAAAELAEGGCQLDGFEDACLAARRKLEAAAAARALQAAERASLPALDGSKGSPCGPASYRCPRGVVPPQRGPSEEAEGLEAAKLRAAANLGSLPVPAETAENDAVGWLNALQAALQQCTKQAGGSDMAAQHALSMVERELFSRAADADRLQAAEALGQAGVQTLYEVVQSYRRGECLECLLVWLAAEAVGAGMWGWPCCACRADTSHSAAVLGVHSSRLTQLHFPSPTMQCYTASWPAPPARRACEWSCAVAGCWSPGRHTAWQTQQRATPTPWWPAMASACGQTTCATWCSATGRLWMRCWAWQPTCGGARAGRCSR